MNMEDFQEKMDPTHRMYLCRMLNVKELPEDLLERYAQVKRMVDRIDGHLTPGDLAMIIYVAGIHFVFAETTEGEDARLQAEAGKLAGEIDGGNILTGSIPVAAIAQPLDESDDKVIEEAVEPPVEQPVSGTTGQAVEQPTESAMLWSPGMSVRVLYKEEITPGRIVGISDPSDVGKQVGAAVKLTVEFEGGETETFDEDEVEAV